MMDVMIPTGAGQIGMAIARHMGYGMKIVIGDKRMENAVQIADTMSKLLCSSIIGYFVIYPCFYVGRSIVPLQKHDGGGYGRLFPLIKVSVDPIIRFTVSPETGEMYAVIGRPEYHIVKLVE